MVIDQLTARGVMDASALYEPPLYVPLETRGYLPLFRSRTKITPP
jgi:hypothetical protein